MADNNIIRMRPYARLLTMLGEQLIKNDRIALIEIIKNSYDADATWVKISFNNFGDNYLVLPGSNIIIEDNGCGMGIDIIKNHLLNPATPEKLQRKVVKDTTDKGRIIQGEKGIGRFALMKLGKNIKIITRPKEKDVEYEIIFDFSKFDDDFLKENGKEKVLFLDDISVSLKERSPIIIKSFPFLLGKTQKISREPFGTRIEISDLKGSWSEKKIESLYNDLTRLENIFDEPFSGSKKEGIKEDSFNVYIYKGQEYQNLHENYLAKLKPLLQNRPVIKLEHGIYDENKKEFRFLLNGNQKIFTLNNPDINGLKVFKDWLKERFGEKEIEHDKIKTVCGSFEFSFFVFDLSSQAPAKFLLDKEDKAIIKDHRIYLYRDGVRVYPYGEKDDDWLRIDMYRGTISAGQFLSNDQVVGCINISQKNNPKLRDKTNREGLIDEGDATGDFIALLQTILSYIRQKPYARYKEDLKDKNVHDLIRTEQIKKYIEQLKEIVHDKHEAFNLAAKIDQEYRIERKYLIQRAETTEELAGVGLSVETASHDIMAIMGKAMSSIDGLISDILSNSDLDREELQKELHSLRGMLSFIEAQLKDIQLLFKSSKQRRRAIKVKEIIDKVERIYRRTLKKEGIVLEINEAGSPLIAKTTDAVLLQLFLNLFDNAVYWLQQTDQKPKKIEIILDGNYGKLIFSDNGPGISKDDTQYIFEPFYSGKGEEGRGLGLYIARQLLERNDYSIELADQRRDLILNGANFVVNFIANGDLI